MPRISSRRKAFEARQLTLDLSGSCDLWLDDLAPAATVRPALSMPASAGPVVGASLVFSAQFKVPCGFWKSHRGYSRAGMVSSLERRA